MMMNVTYTNRDRAGYSLLELLVGGVIFISLLNVCMSLYISFNRLSRNGEAAMTGNDRLAEIDSVFRRTVRDSARPRERFLELSASDSVLILENDAGDGVAVLGQLGESGVFSVARYERIDGKWSVEYLKSFDLDVATYNFDVSRSPAILCTIRVDNEGHRHTLPETNTLLATMRQGTMR